MSTHDTARAAIEKSPFSTSPAEVQTARVSIIGGGVTGGAIANQAIRYYIERLKSEPGLPPLKIDFFEAGGQNGFGSPYDLQTAVFRLNQPASSMSLFGDDGSFVSWLEDWESAKDIKEVQAARARVKEWQDAGLSDAQIAYRDPKTYYMAQSWGRNDFVPRDLYRHYLVDELRKHLARATQINTQLGTQQIAINTHNAWVDNLDDAGDGSASIRVSSALPGGGRMDIVSDSIVLATGHVQNGLLAEFRNNPNYADTPFDMAEVEAMTNGLGADDTVFILGTSQSMLDALAGLEALGFKGHIIAASGSAVEPWPYDPVKHRTRNVGFPFRHITQEKIQGLIEKFPGNAMKIADGLRELIRDELHDPETTKIGGGHALNSLLARLDDWRTIMEVCPGLHEECIDLIDQFKSNSTFDGRFESYMHFKKSGQLEIMRGRVQPHLTRALDSGGFEVTLRDKVDGGREFTLEVSALMNCAAMQRAPFHQDRQTGDINAHHPLADIALRGKFIQADVKANQLAAHADRPEGQVAIAGPARGAQWGVPYTRPEFGDAARKAVDHALNEAIKRQALSL